MPADKRGLFNTDIHYAVKWDRSRTNADMLTLKAEIYVGDATVGAGTPVALEIAGQRFTGTLDDTLRDSSNPKIKWQAKTNIKGKAFGVVDLKVQITHANLGLGFNLAGATAAADLHEVISVDIPAHIEVEGQSFDIVTGSVFKFSKAGAKATGSGTGP